MITEQLIWFIDSRIHHQTTTLDKIVRLANIHQKSIKIVIDVSAQITGHGYWHLFSEKNTFKKELIKTVEDNKNQLLKYFSMNAIKVEVAINESDDYLTTLNANVESNINSIVIIEDNSADKRHAIFQHLADINAPVLLLTKKLWKHPINFLVAVDPLHENARPEMLDTNIVSLTKSWVEKFKAKWTVAHCFYIASVLTKYKTNVRTMHREGLDVFAKNLKIPHDQCVLLEGIPEDALSSYIHQHHVDIITIGLVARNQLNRLWVGSTTTALLSNPPCDMLLIKH
jgi:nucleotide-binding universal stress UspA family protein